MTQNQREVPRSRRTKHVVAFWVSKLRAPRAWHSLTFVMCAVLAIGLIDVYYPGGANIDIANQARQAAGEIPYSDWHPPIMSAFWQLLYALTGTLGSLLVIQVCGFCCSGWLLCIATFRHTRNRLASLLPIAALLTPWGLSQIGMLWKDSQMAVAYLLATALLALIRPAQKRSLWLLLPAAVLLIYGTGVRKNALPALLPFAILISWFLIRAYARSGRVAAKKGIANLGLQAGISVAVMAALACGLVGAESAVSAAHNVRKTGQSTQIMLDDVIFSIPPGELEASPAPRAFVKHAEKARRQCQRLGEEWDAYWNCWGRGEGGAPFSPLPQTDQREIRRLWTSEVITHPARYLAYRAHVFRYYASTSSLEYWPHEWKGEASGVGLGAENEHGYRVVGQYVDLFNASTHGWTFKPWFWIMAGALALIALRFVHGVRAVASTLIGSAILYMAAYFFVAPANHFRYTYWPVIAILAAWALIISGAAVRRQGEHPSAPTTLTNESRRSPSEDSSARSARPPLS